MSYNVNCPDPLCDGGILEINENTKVGDVLTCKNCFSDVEVLSVNEPIKVELIVESK